MKVIALLACLVVAAYIVPGEAAIKCYVCTSVLSDFCKDTYAAPEADTNGGCDYCSKSTLSDIVTRGCLSGTKPSLGCTESDAGSVCFCDGDKCNSATTLYLTGATLISALAMKFLL